MSGANCNQWSPEPPGDPGLNEALTPSGSPLGGAGESELVIFRGIFHRRWSPEKYVSRERRRDLERVRGRMLE